MEKVYMFNYGNISVLLGHCTYTNIVLVEGFIVVMMMCTACIAKICNKSSLCVIHEID